MGAGGPGRAAPAGAGPGQPGLAGPAALAGWGPELPGPERDEWADQLEAVLAQLPPGMDRQSLVTNIWLVDAATLLRGQGWNPAWQRPPPLAVHRPTPATVPGTPSAAPVWVDGTLHLIAGDPVAVVPALVAEVFGPWWGFDAAQARVLAALSARALPGTGSVRPVERTTRDRLAELFADRSDWRALAVAWADDPAVTSAVSTPPAGTAVGYARGRLTGVAIPRPNLRPENYPAEVELAARWGVTPVLLGSPAAADLVRVQPNVKGVLRRDGRIWLIPATLPAPESRPRCWRRDRLPTTKGDQLDR